MNAPHAPSLDYPLATPPAPGEGCMVAPGVLWIRMPLPFALDHINLWLLQEADGWTLVDCGYGDATTRALWEAHFARTLDGRPITRIIATHFHPDHLGNARWLSERFRCPIVMTQAEFLTAHAVLGQHTAHSHADVCALFAAHGMAPGFVAALAARGSTYGRGVPGAPERFAGIQDGDDIVAGGTPWRVVCGDPLARFLASPAATAALPSATLVLPSHGLPFRGLALRVAQLQAHHADRLAELADAVAAAIGPVSAADLVPVLFRRELDAQQRYFAMGEAIAHLHHLWHGGRIERTVATDGAIRFNH